MKINKSVSNVAVIVMVMSVGHVRSIVISSRSSRSSRSMFVGYSSVPQLKTWSWISVILISISNDVMEQADQQPHLDLSTVRCDHLHYVFPKIKNK